MSDHIKARIKELEQKLQASFKNRVQPTAEETAAAKALAVKQSEEMAKAMAQAPKNWHKMVKI